MAAYKAWVFIIGCGTTFTSMPHLPVTALFKRLRKPLEANGEHADYPSPPHCCEIFRKLWGCFPFSLS